MALNLRSFGNFVRSSLRFLERFQSPVPGGQADQRGPAAPRPRAGKERADGSGPGLPSHYPGDFRGTSAVRYAPSPDGNPDPGEVVWTWVPYEEDYSRGKDRPVLLIGSSGRYLLGLMLTTKDHDQDQRADTDYVDLGVGSWDRQGRPSEAKLNRILQISPGDIRREGAVLDRGRFDRVSAALQGRHGWT